VRRDGSVDDSQAKVFGPDLRVRHVLGVEGVPSRARVSPDGRLGAVTLFVTGHSYAAAGTLSTETTLIDLARGTKIAELEDFRVTNAGRRVTAVDLNFWGVTFARDSDRFYATMATGGKTYLIQGSVRAREAHVIHGNVECPSLSPDGTRVAYKKRGPSRSQPWRLTVLDLATTRETPLSERRSVDDQVEWLNDEHVLYGVDGAVWEARADGSGRPSRYLANADSPAVVRW
jgi:Tol biopolymer transport system component